MDSQEEALERIEKTMSKADFWQRDQDEISSLNQKRSSLKETIDLWQKFHEEVEEGKILAEMANSIIK